MKLLVVGTVAYDTVKTPFGERGRVLGGSAAYCGVAASFFTPVSLVAVVGEDFEEPDRRLLESRGIDLAAVATLPGGKTFHWQGEYGYDLNDAKTVRTDLNVLADFDPEVPKGLQDSPFVFLANIDPRIQARVLDQVNHPQVVAADTMNYWIGSRRKEILDLLPRIDVLVINEAEARQLAEEYNLVRAGRKILAWGPRMLIIKRGEYGVLKMTGDSIFAAPAYPLESVFDPTGAGDTFAGGFVGYLASVGDTNPDTVRQAIIMGSVMASYNVEDFSMSRLLHLSREDIEARFRAFRRLTEFDDL